MCRTSSEAVPVIPVVLCTGFSERMPEERAKTLGIKGFLMKPIVMKDLSKTIREVLDNKESPVQEF
jgi:response regulator RpfG family c-di-GMP phosphodiesterase